MTLTVITPPGEPAVPLASAKDYLRIGTDSEDALVAELVEAATQRLEQAASLALVMRVLELRLTAWPGALAGRGVVLRPGPVRSIDRIEIIDADREREDVTSRFRLDVGRLCLRPWSFAPPIPTGGAAVIRFTAGFGMAGDVPADLGLAVKLLVAEAYGPSRSAEALPPRVADIIAARREVRL